MSELKPSTMTDDERLKLITWLESRAQGSTMPGASRMYKLALDAIRARPANEPLTLEQLREMDGEPVFAVDGEGHSAWVVVNAKDECCADNEFGSWAFSYYEMMMPTVLTESENKLHPMGWLAYRHKPKEEHHEAN